MSFLSGLKVFGTGIEKAFAWFGSPKGQSIVATGEGLLKTLVPASAPIIDLFNSWAAKAYNAESIFVAAGKATGSGADKSTLVIGAVESDVLQYVMQSGVTPRTPAQIKTANDALITFINAMTQ